MVEVKICGLTAADQVAEAVKAGADYLGLVFFARSPRNLDPARAAELAAEAGGARRVALTVDATDAELDAILARVPVEILQLHGRESPARVAEIRARFGLPVMKAVGVAGPEDLALLARHEAVADRVLVDAKAPAGAALPGGNGLSFDWRLVAGRAWPRPWMLAGGLSPENVAEAVRRTGAPAVDVSSGVERAPGIKDATRVRAFVAAAKAAG